MLTVSLYPIQAKYLITEETRSRYRDRIPTPIGLIYARSLTISPIFNEG